MDNYQFYSLDRQGRTARPLRVGQFKDDKAALAEARKLLRDQTIEIWQGERCVATLLQMQRGVSSTYSAIHPQGRELPRVGALTRP